MVDLDGNPLVGFPVHIWGAGLDVVVTSGGAPNGYGSPAGWEQFFDSQPKEMVVNVQLHDPYRDSHPPISDVLEIRFPGPYCGSALGWVTFTKNWEDWP